MQKMNKIGIILCAFLCVSLAVAGCSSPSYQQSTPQHVEQEYRSTLVDTTQSLTSSVNYPLPQFLDGYYEIVVTSDVPISIQQYGWSSDKKWVFADMNPPANQITFYRTTYMGQGIFQGIVLTKPSTAKQNPMVHVTITQVTRR